MTDKQRVHRLLIARGDLGVSPVDFQSPTIDGGKPIMRVAARIKELRDDGEPITTELVNRVALYRLKYEQLEMAVAA